MANKLIFGVVEEQTSPPSPPDMRVWMYRNGEAKLFNGIAEVPVNEGWTDSPSQPQTPKKSKK